MPDEQPDEPTEWKLKDLAQNHPRSGIRALAAELLRTREEIRRLRAERDEALAVLRQIATEIRLAGDYDHAPDTNKCYQWAATVVAKLEKKPCSTQS